MIALILLPGGLICISYAGLVLLAHNLGRDLLADTKGILGAGVPTSAKVHQVACSENHYGTNRRGSTEYECTLFLTNAQQDRIERTCAANHTGRIPTLRLISTNPDEYAVSWGASELISRYVFILVFPAVFIVAFGVACLYVSFVGWRRTRNPTGPQKTNFNAAC